MKEKRIAIRRHLLLCRDDAVPRLSVYILFTSLVFSETPPRDL